MTRTTLPIARLLLASCPVPLHQHSLPVADCLWSDVRASRTRLAGRLWPPDGILAGVADALAGRKEPTRGRRRREGRGWDAGRNQSPRPGDFRTRRRRFRGRGDGCAQTHFQVPRKWRYFESLSLCSGCNWSPGQKGASGTTSGSASFASTVVSRTDPSHAAGKFETIVYRTDKHLSGGPTTPIERCSFSVQCLPRTPCTHVPQG